MQVTPFPSKPGSHWQSKAAFVSMQNAFTSQLSLSKKHSLTKHVLLQPSSLLVFPSSHASTPACTWPSPHEAAVQSLKHESELMRLPSSHASPATTLPSPQMGFRTEHGRLKHANPTSTLQLASHPSPDKVLLSSHASLNPTTPSPHKSLTHSTESALIESTNVSATTLSSTHTAPASVLAIR